MPRLAPFTSVIPKPVYAALLTAAGTIADRMGHRASTVYPSPIGRLSRPARGAGMSDAVGPLVLRPLYAGCLLFACHTASAADYTYTVITPPGSTQTTPVALDNSGTVLGIWVDSSDAPHGFTYQAGTITNIDYPKAIYTQPSGFNSKGEIVGSYVLSDHIVRAFLYSHGKFRDIVAPGAAVTEFAGINSKGVSLGYSNAGSGSAFTYKKGVFTTINNQDYVAPVAINSNGSAIGNYYPPQPQPITTWLYSGGTLTTLPVQSSQAESYGINNKNEVVGTLIGTKYYEGFSYSKGTVTSVFVPASTGTYPESLNDLGQIVGYYTDASYNELGFVLTNGNFAKLSAPGAAGSYGFAINKSGQVLGGYHDASRTQYVFLATPTQ